MPRPSVLLSLYRAASAGLSPLAPAYLYLRRRQGRLDRRGARELTGMAGLARPEGRLIWVHAATLGDGRTVLPLVERLGARGFHVLVSTRTATPAKALRRQLPAGAFHQYAPLDLPRYVSRFLDHWRPDMVLFAGADLWPNVTIQSNDRGAPIVVVNGSVSDGAYRRLRLTRRFVGALMGRIDLCLARSDLDAERFVDLGAVSVQTVGDLVFDVPAPAADPIAVGAFGATVGARPVWLASIADPAEDAALILAAHRLLLPRHPDLLTIVLPRLPADGAAIARDAASQNLAVALRSRDGMPGRPPGIFVADGAGESGLIYRAGEIAFIGRSRPGLGHGPIEAAKLGCAILHRPDDGDFEAIYDALDHAHGGVEVHDAPTLAKVLAALFEDGAKVRRMQRNATQTMDRMCGGTARVLRAIEPHVVQMLVGR